jgi:hypothetical protein
MSDGCCMHCEDHTTHVADAFLANMFHHMDQDTRLKFKEAIEKTLARHCDKCGGHKSRRLLELVSHALAMHSSEMLSIDMTCTHCRDRVKPDETFVVFGDIDQAVHLDCYLCLIHATDVPLEDRPHVQRMRVRQLGRS